MSRYKKIFREAVRKRKGFCLTSYHEKERKQKMKKLLILVGAVAASFCVMAGPHGGPGGGPRGGGPGMGHHPAPGGGGHHDGWGRGGRNFWPGFVGGVVGGAISRAVLPPPAPVVVSQPAVVVSPTVVTTPVVTTPVVTQVTQTQQVWVPGAYVDQVQPNGTVVRVWSPGHYETRTVYVQ
jgi:hypothetical protein